MGGVGVLALQGDVREHLATLSALGVGAVRVRTPGELDTVAALVLQLGAEAVFVGSGIFKSEDPVRMAHAIVEASTHFDDPAAVAKVSTGLGSAMRGWETSSLDQRLAERGW